MKASIKIMVIMLITASNFSFGQSTEPNGRTYAVRLMTLKEGVNPIEFEKYALEKLDPAFRNVPGGEAKVAKADRGTDKGIYLLIYFYDSKATRNHYYPEENAEKVPDATLEMHSHIEKSIVGLYEFVEQEPTSLEYTDYVFIE